MYVNRSSGGKTIVRNSLCNLQEIMNIWKEIKFYIFMKWEYLDIPRICPHLSCPIEYNHWAFSQPEIRFEFGIHGEQRFTWLGRALSECLLEITSRSIFWPSWRPALIVNSKEIGGTRTNSRTVWQTCIQVDILSLKRYGEWTVQRHAHKREFKWASLKLATKKNTL